MNNPGDIQVEVSETSGGRYVRARWRNGVLPMHADINGPMDLHALNRLAAEIDADVYVTPEAMAEMEARGNQ
jgi:hypothetical protein